MKNLLFLFLILIFSSCAAQLTRKKLKLETSPVSAYVDLNGVLICKKTPCTVTLYCVMKTNTAKHGYYGGSKYVFDFYPIKKNKKYFPVRKLYQGCSEQGSIDVDLRKRSDDVKDL